MGVVMNNNMKAVLLEKTRRVINETAFFEVVLWHLPEPVPGSVHSLKYRLALVIEGECVLRYDNERGKGDHRHMVGHEDAIEFTTLEASSMLFRLI